MDQDSFIYLYPMPDDVAQSMLISETESNIHIRPLNQNARKLWICNKIIRNLLTQRKTLILIDQPDHIRLLDEIIQEFQLQPLCFLFTHSRSEIEQKLLQFAPVTVPGKLNMEQFENLSKSLKITHQNLKETYDTLYQTKVGPQDNFVSLVSKVILSEQSNKGEISRISNLHEPLMQREFQSLINLLESFKTCKDGRLHETHPLNQLNEKLFELFLRDEAWTYLSHFLYQWKKTGIQILNDLKEYLDLWYICENKRICHQFSKIISELKWLNSNPSDQSEWFLKHQLTVEKFEKYRSFLRQTDTSEFIAFNYRNEIPTLSDLRPEISNYLNRTLKSIKIADIRDREVVLSIKNILDRAIKWQNDMNTSGIIHKTVQLNSETLPELIQSIENDITIAEDILQSSDAFAQFFDWKTQYNLLTERQKVILDQLQFVHPDQWEIELKRHYQDNNLKQFFDYNAEFIPEWIRDFKTGVAQIKSQWTTYLLSKYEQKQHQALYKLIDKEPGLYESLKNNQKNKHTLSEYYQLIPQLAEIFPIIILENSHREYFPTLTQASWDEVWNLCPTEEEQQFAKFGKSTHHYISIHEEFSSIAEFNIALNQAPPSRLKNILFDLHPTEVTTHINGLANFILSNFPKLKVLVNSKNLALSFLPKELEQLFIQLSGAEWNAIQLDEQDGAERLSELLMHKSTHKKIWLADQLFSTASLNIQQLEWQWHFLKCMEVAGFEIENVETNQLFQLKSFWPSSERNLFTPIKNTKLHSV